jgi:hypothetical protein
MIPGERRTSSRNPPGSPRESPATAGMRTSILEPTVPCAVPQAPTRRSKTSISFRTATAPFLEGVPGGQRGRKPLGVQPVAPLASRVPWRPCWASRLLASERPKTP